MAHRIYTQYNNQCSFVLLVQNCEIFETNTVAVSQRSLQFADSYQRELSP